MINTGILGIEFEGRHIGDIAARLVLEPTPGNALRLRAVRVGRSHKRLSRWRHDAWIENHRAFLPFQVAIYYLAINETLSLNKMENMKWTIGSLKNVIECSQYLQKLGRPADEWSWSCRRKNRGSSCCCRCGWVWIRCATLARPAARKWSGCMA